MMGFLYALYPTLLRFFVKVVGVGDRAVLNYFLVLGTGRPLGQWYVLGTGRSLIFWFWGPAGPFDSGMGWGPGGP